MVTLEKDYYKHELIARLENNRLDALQVAIQQYGPQNNSQKG